MQRNKWARLRNCLQLPPLFIEYKIINETSINKIIFIYFFNNIIKN